jgi:hypothetical protein
VDVEIAALTLAERATKTDDPVLRSRAAGALDAVAVLRCERPAETLLGEGA